MQLAAPTPNAFLIFGRGGVLPSAALLRALVAHTHKADHKTPHREPRITALSPRRLAGVIPDFNRPTDQYVLGAVKPEDGPKGRPRGRA